MFAIATPNIDKKGFAMLEESLYALRTPIFSIADTTVNTQLIVMRTDFRYDWPMLCRIYGKHALEQYHTGGKSRQPMVYNAVPTPNESLQYTRTHTNVSSSGKSKANVPLGCQLSKWFWVCFHAVAFHRTHFIIQKTVHVPVSPSRCRTSGKIPLSIPR